MIAWILISVIVALVYFWLRKGLNYWKDLGIPYPEPTVLFGNFGESFLMKKNVGVVLSDIYRQFEGYPFVGIYKSQTPCLMVRDPEFIKNIYVKDFKSFAHNDFPIDQEVDPILGRNPFVLVDEEWKSRRSQLTPAFTTGRMKAMYPLIEAVGNRLVKYLENQPEALDAKEVSTKFTVDNVASCAFGVEGKCFEGPNSDFRELAQKFLSPGGWTDFVFLILGVFPDIAKFFKIKLVPKEVDERLLETVRQALKYRKENNIKREDFLDFVAKLEYETKNLRELDIAAHAASFFADGFETSSIVMTYLLFELAYNQDVQKRLRGEINSVVEEKYDGQISYDAIQDMPYLHACMYESMRKNPVAQNIAKICTRAYSYTSTSKDFKNMTVELKPGDKVIIPTTALHLDPKYYPEPDKFIPERFLNNANKSLYLVFGEGPRVCLGQRFGLLQIKVAVAFVIKNFEITVNPKTTYPFDYLTNYFFFLPKSGVWLNFNKI